MRHEVLLRQKNPCPPSTYLFSLIIPSPVISYEFIHFFMQLFFLFFLFQNVGCDFQLDSDAVEDVCGICNGDGTQCKIVDEVYKDTGAHGNNVPSDVLLSFRYCLRQWCTFNVSRSKLYHQKCMLYIDKVPFGSSFLFDFR